MKRRTFFRMSAAAVAGVFVDPLSTSGVINPDRRIRLGGPVFEKYTGPDEWIRAVRNAGYTAGYCPVGTGTDEVVVKEYRAAASRNGIIIAEVGAWSNPISPDSAVAAAAMQKCISSLELADQIGAMCCVNISGSRNVTNWAGPHPDNLTPDTFDLIVETTRKIIDAVKPTATWYSLEAMPWTYPDSADSYLKLIKAIDRERFAVHLDPVNFVTSPQVLFSNGEMIRESFRKLGPWIKSCHAKDVVIRENTYLPQLDEIMPGKGLLDYSVFLTELSKLDNVPLMMEHLDSAGDYAHAARFIRNKAHELNISI
jgi:sugar phosphate isomerase/epimerase